MAEDVTEAQAVAEPAAVEAPRPSSAVGVLVGRFRFVYAALALLLGAAIGGFLVLSGDSQTTGPAWSAWEPDGDPSERASEIAQFVSRQYRLESRRQLVAVSVTKPPTVGQQPVRYVALSAGTSREDISVLSADGTMAYQLCGIPPGANCSIREGEPSAERGLLLRREALELALYTFKYVDGVDSVVAFLPPRLKQQTRFALFFQRDDLDAALDRPLRATLAPSRELTPSTLAPTERFLVDRYVDSHIFQASYGQAGDGSIYLALVPLPL
jgi:hypothetical protein